MSEKEKIIAVAKNEIGYKEKKSNASLDSKTSNAGANNYTKYGRDLKSWVPEAGATFGINYEWCDQFVNWVFITALGKARAKALLGGWSAYTPTSAQYFKKMNRLDTTPEVGSVVFFYKPAKKRIAHVGIVYKVDNNKVYTIEGNASNEVGYHSYLRSNSNLSYGHPAYQETGAVTSSASVIPRGTIKTPVVQGTVTASSLNVRVWAGTENSKIKKYPSLKKGTVIDVCSYIMNGSEKWYYIRYNGVYGFVCAKYVSISK